MISLLVKLTVFIGIFKAPFLAYSNFFHNISQHSCFQSMQWSYLYFTLLLISFT